MSNNRILNGWPLLGVLSLALVVMTAALVFSNHLDVAGIRLAIRATLCNRNAERESPAFPQCRACCLSHESAQ